MAVVIPFAPRRRRSERQQADAPREAATILFFTGIRYERHAEPQATPKPARRPRRAGTGAKPIAKNARQPA